MLTISQSFRCSYFKTPSLNHLWWSLVEFWSLYTVVLFILKNDSTRDNSLNFLEVKLSSLKNLWWIPILVPTCNICKNRLVHRLCLSGYCEKYLVQSTELRSSILVKKTLSLDLPWVRISKTGKAFCWRCFIPLATSRKFFESLFLKNLQAFLVNDEGSISRNVA